MEPLDKVGISEPHIQEFVFRSGKVFSVGIISSLFIYEQLLFESVRFFFLKASFVADIISLFVQLLITREGRHKCENPSGASHETN